MGDRRILILGEGFSHDPHYGKTMRVIIRYGRPFEVGPGESGLADGMVEAERRLEEIAGVLP